MACQSKKWQNIWPAPVLEGEINFSLPFLFIELPKWSCLLAMSHIVKINVFMICIFIIFKLVYFTAVKLDLHFKYKRI
jgi:hypothetical protein